jgi:hypothetical protein
MGKNSQKRPENEQDTCLRNQGGVVKAGPSAKMTMSGKTFKDLDHVQRTVKIPAIFSML